MFHLRKRKLQLLPLHFASSSIQAAKAGTFAYLTGEPPSLFELRRVRKAGKGRAIAKRRRILQAKRVLPSGFFFHAPD
jgi:hypothetical protein